MLREKLAKIITSRPEVIQFTKDRKFEEVWVIPLEKRRPSPEKIDDYLSREKFDLLIIEYVWNFSDNDNRFVLTVFLDKNCTLQDPRQFIDICLDSFEQYSGFSELLDLLDTKVIGHPYLFQDPVEAVNLGIFNNWFSTGPVDLWKQGEIFNLASVIQKIKARPEIEKTNLNFQGLFFRFNTSGKLNGPYYGLKTPCCHKVDDVWRVDFNKVSMWITNLIDV